MKLHEHKDNKQDYQVSRAYFYVDRQCVQLGVECEKY